MADEVKVGGSANARIVPIVAGWSSEGALAAGRQEAVGTVLGAVTVVDPDGGAARALARREVAVYIDVVGHLDPTVEIPAEVARGIRDALRRDGPGAAAHHVPDELLACFAFAGTPQQVAAQAVQVLQAGASRVEFGTPHGLTEDSGVGLLGSAVLPAIREATAA
jgi:5,10-methylenetetrahydromethanopterin reductase